MELVIDKLFALYRSARLFPAPSPVLLSKFALTPLRPRPPLPRSLPSLSSVFVVSRRRLVSLRLVVFCRSGTSIRLGREGEKFGRRISSRQTTSTRIYNCFQSNAKLILNSIVMVSPVFTV